ncbi:MAG: hypothetical protein ACRC1Z_03945 [Waterburya sp.]
MSYPNFDPDLSRCLENYLEESKTLTSSTLKKDLAAFDRFEWKKLIKFKSKKPIDKNIIIVFEIIAHESKFENELKKIIVDEPNKKIQKSKLKDLKQIASKMERVQERLSSLADERQRFTIVISSLAAFFIVWIEFGVGNELIYKLPPLSVIAFFNVCIDANVCALKRLASNTKCIEKTAKEVLELFPNQ